MPYTEEPKGLEWINNMNTASMGSLVTNFCWLFGSIAFTLVACYLLVVVKDNGMTLAGALLAAWGVKTGAGVTDANLKRKADPKYKEVLEAKERGKVTGVAAAAVLAEKVAITKEHTVPDNHHPTTPTEPVADRRAPFHQRNPATDQPRPEPKP
jgi:hypothetical protein